MNTKNLNEYSFNEDLKLAFINTDIQTCEEFEEIFMNSSCTFKGTIIQIWKSTCMFVFI